MIRALLLAVLVAVFQVLSCPAAEAQKLAVGIDHVPPSESIPDGKGIYAALLRTALTRAMVRYPEKPEQSGGLPYALDLADSLKISPDLKSWSLRLSAGAEFAGGEPILGRDLVYSLERCRSAGSIPEVTEISSRTERFGAGSDQIWLDLSLREPLSDNASLAGFTVSLAGCPVYHRESSEIFSDTFGYSNNIVSSGDYRFVDLVPDKQLRLVRNQPRSGAPEEIEIRFFESPDRALAALRDGSLQMLFSEEHRASDEVADKASKDPTLSVARCLGRRLVYRRGITVRCSRESMDFGSLFSDNR